ncbi:hypothetical protein C2845_PM05G10530 [Panicum miliaceum]|uniref:Protein gar2-like n=1 Tax=Panicum miliaceum TaxID=4540 RepID=A0A3L6SXZ9_PANMI|nr:hypothetical protein C2845_PM05G10530 [Panicum miliaceum]
MVLARKKLKQKLHTLLPAGEAEVEEAHGEEVQDVKERLASSKRPRPKRPPRKKSLPEEKKEKRRIRRLMEAEAAAETQQVGGEMGAEAEGKEEASEEDDPAVESDQPVVAENREQNINKMEVTKPGVGSNSPVVAENKLQNQEVKLAKSGVGSDNPVAAEHIEQSVKKVYVGGIPYYSSEDDIRSFFEGCGSITAIDCMTFPESGKFRGIAILTFKTDAAAQRALAMDGADMGGFYLKIQPYKHNREKEDFAPKLIEGYNRIYVGNLPWDITEDDLKKFFSDCKISSIRFGTDKETGDFKGYAHVDFSDGTSVAVALKLDQRVIKGRPVRIRCAVPKKDNQKICDNENSDLSKKPPTIVSEEMKVGDESNSVPSKKRRKCYECGISGHLSSACPNKKVAEVVDEVKCDTGSNTIPSTIVEEKKASDDAKSAPAKKKKRRTCYECGIAGHLSSECPNKAAA